MAKQNTGKSVESLVHDEAKRKNIPTAEYRSVMASEEQNPVRVAYARGADGLDPEKESRNRDLDPQLIWRGKDERDWSDLVVHAPPLYIQEKVHPKVLIDDLMRRSDVTRPTDPYQIDLFSDFNGLPDDAARTEFYQHDAHWSNRMILGDSLQVMASLAEREGLRGKVQCIYLDPPYGIKFNSNFQWSTTSRDVKDGNAAHITREPEQVKAFRDTWRDGIYSYLTYLRDRLTVARDLLADSGSIFVQIGDENVHRVRVVMDEVFGNENFIAQIFFKTTSNLGGSYLGGSGDFVIWFARDRSLLKYRQLFMRSGLEQDVGNRYTKVQTEENTRRPMNREERDRVGSVLAKVRVYKTAGVQQAHKEDKINFTSLTPWPGELICAEGRYLEIVGADLSASAANIAGNERINSHLDPDELQTAAEKRAAIFIGPEFGTVSRPDLVAAAREAGDAGFDVLIACAFNYDAHSSEFDKLGRIPVLKARMNADLHMADDLKNTGKGNLFVIFGEPDIDILDADGGKIRVKVNGVDVFHPNTGEVRSDGPEGIACWFSDTDYNEEAWATLNSDISRPFDKPKSGRIAVKVINHLGDEVMKVFRV